MKTFEQFLMEKFYMEYHGPDDDMPDAFDAWLCNIEPDDWIKHADAYAGAYITAMNHAHDHIRDGQAMLAGRVLAKALGLNNT